MGTRKKENKTAARPATDKVEGLSLPVTVQQALDWLFAHRLELAGLVAYAFILVIRAPWVLVMGRFWAEEATVYFQYAWTHSFLEALVAPHLGYYDFVPNFATILATHVPLEWAPRLTAATGLLVQMLPAGLVLFTSIPGLVTPWHKAAALMLLLTVPANPEIYLNTINAHFVLCAVAGLILVAEHGGRLDRVLKWLLLGLAGLTGAVSTFLAPLFWLQWWKERRRERLVQALILTCCLGLQFMFSTRALAEGQRHLRFHPSAMAGTAYAKFLVTPLVPARAAFQYLEQLRLGLAQGGGLPAWVWLNTVVALAGFVFACWRSPGRNALLLAAAAFGVSVVSFAASREAESAQELTKHLTYALRYYYAPEVFFFLALLMSLAPGSGMPRVLKALVGLWLGSVLLMGMINFACAPMDWPTSFSGPPWQPQVERWRRDPTKPLAVWPVGWEVNLEPKAGGAQ
jgi:hypothetical protein